MTRPTTNEPSRRPSAAPDNTAEPDPTRAGAKHTGHIRIRGFGISPDKALFIRLDFSYGGRTKSQLLPLAGLNVTSYEFDRLNVDGARLISPQARRELIDRVQATVEEGPRFAVATRLGWRDKHFASCRTR